MSTTFVAAAGSETAPIQDGLILFEPKTGKFIMLNSSAAFLWSELSTPKTEDELASRLSAAFSGVATAGPDVREALEGLGRLELVVTPAEASGVDAARTAPHGNGHGNDGKPASYEAPTLRVLDEEELLNVFQMTAAEISVASCWWSSCPSGCP